MSESMNRTAEFCQPCDNYTLGSDDIYPHICPDCEGIRYYCVNCHKDHHKGGWNSCEVTSLMEGCRHPACKEKVAAFRDKKETP